MSNFYGNKDNEDSRKPFFTVAKKSKEDKLDWLVAVKESLEDEASERITRQRQHLRAYLGLNPRYESVRGRATIGLNNRRRKPRFPHIHDLIETKVSQMTRIKPDIEVLPADDEHSDRGAAKVAKQVVRNIFEQQDLDHKTIELHRAARIFGESYLFIDFNKNIGDLHPTYVAAKEMGLADKYKGELRIGDVEYSIELPWRIFLQRKDCIDDVEYYFRYKVRPIDEVMQEYNVEQEDIGVDEKVYTFNGRSMQDEYQENSCLVWEFVHKKTKHVPEGYRAVFTNGKILEEGEYPFSMDKLNFVRLTDLDVPGELNGISKLEFCIPMQMMFDNLTAIAAKNLFKTAFARYLIPKTAQVSPEMLADDVTAIVYAGPLEPKQIQANPSPPELYSFRENILNDMQVLMGNHGVSRGEIPKGITAASALQFLNELESERSSSDISKHANVLKELARKTISIAADNYDLDDGRLVRIVGKNNVSSIKHFDSAVLSRPYDIKFDSSSGFPETRAARQQRMVEYMQYGLGELVSPERLLHLLDIGGVDKFVSSTTAAITAAETEVEEILAGEDVESPEFYQDHIAKLRVFYSALQRSEFTSDASNEVVKKMLDHVGIQERLAIEKAKSSSLYSAELANMRMFPITPGLREEAKAVVQSRAQSEAIVQGQANRGEEVTNSIPGQNDEGVK